MINTRFLFFLLLSLSLSLESPFVNHYYSRRLLRLAGSSYSGDSSSASVAMRLLRLAESSDSSDSSSASVAMRLLRLAGSSYSGDSSSASVALRLLRLSGSSYSGDSGRSSSASVALFCCLLHVETTFVIRINYLECTWLFVDLPPLDISDINQENTLRIQQ